MTLRSPTLQSELLASLVLGLMEAKTFEDAASATLKAMLTSAEEALAHSPHAAQGRVLRGVVHLRPAGSYQRLFGIEHPSGDRVEGTGYLTSANVWRWVAENRSAVSIDVPLSTLRTWSAEGPSEHKELRASAGLPGRETRERMMGRDATHVHVIPLCAPAGSVDGMITLEASARAAIGHDFIWPACHERLQVISGVAAPYLAALPLTPVKEAATDELLPVIGPSTASLIDLLRVFSRQEETILLSGPTGAGKSRLARWCHEQSARKGHPFETMSLLSVPEDLQMAELFGWKRGAFTGAVKDAQGAITRAARGTLFIDEIDKLSMRAQAGLLRVLEEQRYRPLGDNASEQRANVRFIVGTNTDLHAALRAGRFREDLYYRINVLPLRLPPLAERLDELPLWAEYMLARRHQESGGGGGAPSLAPEAIALLRSTSWPGNLRQLDNIIRRAYALALADRGASGGAPGLLRLHIERSLAYEGGADPSSLLRTLWRAARAFVDEAERREQSAAPLSLDLCEAFRGMVLGAAVQRRGSREEGFLLLGQRKLLKNRNHYRALRRELDHVRELLRSVGGEVEPELQRLLDEAEASSD
jgi:DNA-binding NtrC family response regulator